MMNICVVVFSSTGKYLSTYVSCTYSPTSSRCANQILVILMLKWDEVHCYLPLALEFEQPTFDIHFFKCKKIFALPLNLES